MKGGRPGVPRGRRVMPKTEAKQADKPDSVRTARLAASGA